MNKLHLCLTPLLFFSSYMAEALTPQDLDVIRLVQEAIRCDQDKDYRQAIKTYKSAVESLRIRMKNPTATVQQEKLKYLHDACYARGEDLYYKLIRKAPPPSQRV